MDLSPREGARPAQPCCSDIIHLLRNYEQCLSDILYEGYSASEELSAENAAVTTENEEKNARRYWEDSEEQIEEAQGRYLQALAAEHENWFKRETEVQDQHVASRKYELEVVERHLVEHGRTQLQEALQERCDQHLALLTPGVEGAGAENRFVQAEKARQEWTTEVCKAVIMEMRKEWRTGQRKVLQQLAGELRAERKAAADALERQMAMSKKVSDALKGMWANEIGAAQDELDHVAEAYKRALKLSLEAKLREARQHCKEQAEFFQKEIREALLFEQKERAAHDSQLRRMRLAMLKWRFDYKSDAKRKANELVARGVLAKLSAAGLSASDVMMAEVEARKEEKKEIKRQERAAAKATEPPKEAKKPKPKPEASSGSSDKGVSFGADMSDDDEEDESESDVSSSDISSIEIPADWVPDQDLNKTRIVAETIWPRLPEGDEAANAFLMRLEEAIPYEEEILIMYEEELMRHGVVSALDATDGRAEEALQAEREAQAQDVHSKSLAEIQPHKTKTKKAAKPAVPTVARRQKLNFQAGGN